MRHLFTHGFAGNPLATSRSPMVPSSQEWAIHAASFTLTCQERERLPPVLFWTLPFQSRLSLRVPGDSGMRPWTKDV